MMFQLTFLLFQLLKHPSPLSSSVPLLSLDGSPAVPLPGYSGQPLPPDTQPPPIGFTVGQDAAYPPPTTADTSVQPGQPVQQTVVVEDPEPYINCCIIL